MAITRDIRHYSPSGFSLGGLGGAAIFFPETDAGLHKLYNSTYSDTEIHVVKDDLLEKAALLAAMSELSFYMSSHDAVFSHFSFALKLLNVSRSELLPVWLHGRRASYIKSST